MDNKKRVSILLKNRIYGFSFLIYNFNFLIFWNFALGLLILSLRTLGIVGNDHFESLWVGIPIGLLISIFHIGRNPISEKKLIAILDSYNNAGGVLISAEETGDQQWEPKLCKEYKIPGLKLHLSNHIFLLLLSFLFLIAGLRIDIPSRSVIGPTSIDLRNSEQKSTLKIDTLEETGLIEEKSSEELKKALEHIKSESDGLDPSRTFESLDNLENKISREAEKGISELQKHLEALQGLKNLSDKLQKSAEISPQELKKAKNEMKEMLEKAMGKDSKADKALKQLSDSLNLDNKELSKASKNLQEYIKNETQKMKQNAERLMKAKVIDKATFEKLKKAGKVKEWDGKTPLKQGEFMFVEGENGKNGNRGLTPCQSGGNQIGKGGVSRGPGTSKIKHNRISSEHGVKFKDEALPAPTINSLDDSEVVGIGMTAPDVNNEIDANVSSTNWDIKARNNGRTHLVLPKHRAIVRDYFSREKTGK